MTPSPNSSNREREAVDWYDEPDFEEEDDFDCHMGPSGHCGAAGSEDCEFECPYRREQRQQQQARRDRRVKPMPLFPQTEDKPHVD